VYLENKITKKYFFTGLLPWICNPEHQHLQGPSLELKVIRGYSDSYSGCRGRIVVRGQLFLAKPYLLNKLKAKVLAD
jgi:hypothetical protein